MKGVEIHLQVQARVNVNESIEQRHAAFIDEMLQVGPPLGMRGLAPPGAPSIAPMSGNLLGGLWFKYPIKGLKLQMTSLYRGKSVGKDLSMNDDRISIDFKTSNKALHYASLLREQFPAVIKAYRGYRARAKFASYSMKYTDMFWNQWENRPTTNETYWRLRATPGIDIDGRNNIYTLEPAVFWDGELCRRALGYGPEEVMRRLSGHALLVLPLLDGVYVVFNDDPSLTYEAFVDMNGRFKQLLGID